MVYMVDQSILTPEIGSSNPVIVSFIYTQQYQIRCADKVKMKKKGPGMAKILSCWRHRTLNRLKTLSAVITVFLMGHSRPLFLYFCLFNTNRTSDHCKRILIFTFVLNKYLTNNWEVVVAQLVEWSLPIPEIRGSNPDIDKIYIEHLFTVSCAEKTKIKKKKTGMAHFFKKT